MHIIYAIHNIHADAFVRYGQNGGGETGYCLYRGRKCFWNTREAAQEVVESFANPEEYEIRAFAELDD